MSVICNGRFSCLSRVWREDCKHWQTSGCVSEDRSCCRQTLQTFSLYQWWHSVPGEPYRLSIAQGGGQNVQGHFPFIHWWHLRTCFLCEAEADIGWMAVCIVGRSLVYHRIQGILTRYYWVHCACVYVILTTTNISFLYQTFVGGAGGFYAFIRGYRMKYEQK